jgi:thymidylate kinase
MIIELFGPPGAGKTTFAHTLAARLRERNYTVDLILSHRPAERSPNEIRPASEPAGRKVSSPVRRLTRPLAELLSMVRQPRAISRDLGTALKLIKILPPSTTLSSLRLAQYTSRLSRAWFRTSNTGHIVLFDQAFVQAVCSLALICGVADEVLISHALDFIPEPDLLVRLDAPTEILEERLRDRQLLASRIERLFELDLATSLRSRAIIDLLHKLLRKKGKKVVQVSSLDQGSLNANAEQIERQITSIIEQQRRHMTKSARAQSTLPDQTEFRRPSFFDPSSKRPSERMP